MTTDTPKDQPQPELAELSTLQFKGMANVELASIPALVRRSGVDLDEDLSGSEPRNAVSLHLAAAVRRLPEMDQQVATVLFGLSKEAYVWGVHRRHQAVELETGMSWSSYRHTPFAGLCLRLLAALGELPTIGIPSSSKRSNLGYRLQLLESEYLVPTAHDPAVVITEHRRIVADVDGFAEWRIPTDYRTSALDGEPTIRLIGGGHLTFDPVMLRDQEGAGFKADISVLLPRPLMAGEIFDFKLYRRVPVDIHRYWAASGPFYTGYGLEPQTDVLKLSLQFDKTRPPTRIEKQNGVLPSRQFIFGAEGTESIALDDSARVNFEWRGPKSRDWYGAIWE